MGLGGFRDPNPSNLDKGISKVSANFETRDKREVLGIISIHVDDLLISGSSDFTDYISWEMGGGNRGGYLRWGRGTYLGSGIKKKGPTRIAKA